MSNTQEKAINRHTSLITRDRSKFKDYNGSFKKNIPLLRNQNKELAATPSLMLCPEADKIRAEKKYSAKEILFRFSKIGEENSPLKPCDTPNFAHAAEKVKFNYYNREKFNDQVYQTPQRTSLNLGDGLKS